MFDLQLTCITIFWNFLGKGDCFHQMPTEYGIYIFEQGSVITGTLEKEFKQIGFNFR